MGIPCEFEAQPAAQDLPKDDRCEASFLNAGDLQLRVSISAPGSAGSADWVARIKAIADLL